MQSSEFGLSVSHNSNTRVLTSYRVKSTKRRVEERAMDLACTPYLLLFEGRLALNPGFFFLCSKAFSRVIFCAIFRASNHQLADKKN